MIYVIRDNKVVESVDESQSSSQWPLIDPEPYRLSSWQLTIGIIDTAKDEDSNCVAKIGPLTVILPQVLTPLLLEAKGKRVGILASDKGYRLRIVTDDRSDRDANSNPPNIVQDDL